MKIGQSNNWRVGLALALLATLCWGIQPLAFGFLVKTLSPASLSFFKLFSAALILGTLLFFKRSIPDYRIHGGKTFFFLILAAVAFALSYILYASGYLYISAGNTQFYIQLSRILLALAGVFFFKERFDKKQWLALIAVLVGFFFFFRDQNLLSGNGSSYVRGAILVALSSIAWTIYAIFQRILLKSFSSQQVLVFICILASLFLLPFGDFKTFPLLDYKGWVALAVICLSNLAAYSFFAEALNQWDTSRVSAISCLTPVITISFTASISAFTSQISKPENLGLRGLLGGCMIVIGSAVISLVQRNEDRN